MRHPAAFGAALLLACLRPAASAAAPVPGPVVDGRFDDWSNAERLYPAAGTGSTGLPVAAVWATSDSARVYLRFRLARETRLQDEGGLVLEVDTDASGATGTPADGLGVDFRWTFADHEGRAAVMGVPLRVSPAAVNLREAPTVSSREFEVSFDRAGLIAGAPFLPGDSLSFALRAPGADGGTFSTGPLGLRLDRRPRAALVPAAIPAPGDGNLRLVSYNVRFDGLFDRPEPFRRILRALDPDVVCFQEIYTHTPEQVRAWMAEALPGREWSAAGDGGQGVTASRYPIRDSGAVGPRRRGGWTRIEAPGGEILLLNPHPPCCNDAAGRRQVFDALAAWIRDARDAGRLPAAEPVVVAGDMNLVGDAAERAALLDGAVFDTASFGPAAPPDGDGTPFADAFPYHLTGNEIYTWRSDGGPFPPGRLDYVVYTDSVLGLARSFVLWTPELARSLLDAAGLRSEDTAVASDHLPVVADFYRLPSGPPR